MRKRALRLVALGISAIMAGSLFVGGVAADPGGLPTIQGIGMIEVNVPSRDVIDQLNDGGWDLSEYRRDEDNGTFTIRVLVDQDELAELAAMGFGIGIVIEDERDWLAARADSDAAREAELQAKELAENGAADPGLGAFGILPPQNLVIQRAVTFDNYAGRFLYVEARSASASPTTGTGVTLAMTRNTGDGTPFGSSANMSPFVDTDPAPDVYLYHRLIVRISALNVATPPNPTMVRVAASNGSVAEFPVTPWLSSGLPPHVAGFMTDLSPQRYLDTYELYDEIGVLAAAYPDLAEIVDLPNVTGGYQRKAMCVMSGTTACSGAGTAASAVYLESLDYAQEWNGSLRAQFVNPGAGSQTLSVSVADNALPKPGGGVGKDIIVRLGTTSSGALNSTAASVVAAINGHAEASLLVRALTYGGNAGTGTVAARALVALSDFLAAPARVPRGPITEKMIRIGKDRDGSKVGIFLYCNQHAREWTTPMVCLETAEQLLKNYATDPLTKELVDNLDIFIIPTSNPAGNIYSRYDFQSQRKNMTNYCGLNTTNGMPTNRNTWGTDQNRNSGEYSGFDGYSGASTSCTSEVFRGLSEYSEPEIKNEVWVSDTFSNIKFANNIHSSGGYFMWAPGSYIAAGRITAPAPNIGIEAYFFKAGERVLARIRETRQTVIFPERTGPIADVLYSAAGNSADDQWYRKGIISYSFETGADRFTSTTTGTGTAGVGGFFPTYATEGKGQILEFTGGNYGLFEEAIDYARDTTAPTVDLMVCSSVSPSIDCTPTTTNLAKQSGAFITTFRFGNEPSVIRYTTDGSTPTMASPTWEAQGPRRPGQLFQWDTTTTLKFFGTDIKGNVGATQTIKLSIDPNAPTIDIVEPQEAVTQVQGQPGNYGLNSAQNASYTCSDDDSGVVSCVGTVADGALFDTSTVGFHTFTVDAVDLAGNTASKTVTYNVIYDQWGGLRPPIADSAGNNAKAGSTVPIKFRIGGNFGLGVYFPGYPQSQQVNCTTGAPIGSPTSITNTLYWAVDQYQIDWKTDKTWSKTCRVLIVKLIDNTVHTAFFKFS